MTQHIVARELIWALSLTEGFVETITGSIDTREHLCDRSGDFLSICSSSGEGWALSF